MGVKQTTAIGVRCCGRPVCPVAEGAVSPRNWSHPSTAAVARLMMDAGLLVICDFVSPLAVDRERARVGEIAEFTGVDARYQVPHGPAPALPNHELTIVLAAERIVGVLNESGVLPASGYLDGGGI